MSEMRDKAAVERETVKKTWSGEMAKLSKMTFSQKTEYIWNYYRIQIALIFLAIFVVVYIIVRIVTYKEPVFYIVVANSDQFNQEKLLDVTEYLGIPTDDEELEYLGGISTEPMAGGEAAVIKLDLHMAAREIDICFGDESAAARLAGSQALLTLDQSLTPELNELWADRVAEFEVYDSVNSDYMVNDIFIMEPVAIDISGTKLHEYFGLDDDTKYFMPVNLSGHEEYYQKFLQMVYDIEMGFIHF